MYKIYQYKLNSYREYKFRAIILIMKTQSFIQYSIPYYIESTVAIWF